MLRNFTLLDGGTLIAIQRSLVGAMVDTTMPYQNGSQICWQERQQWGDNPQWFPICHPIPNQYLQPVYTGAPIPQTASPTVPDGIVRTDPVTKVVAPEGGSPTTTVPVLPKAPLNPLTPGGSDDVYFGGITGDVMPGESAPVADDKPFPWGLLVVAALTLAG